MPEAILTDQLRAVDLVPRQSALNVNQTFDRASQFNLKGIFTFLTGFGASTEFQRQREQFEQFIHQDVFASAFGKGAQEFGWTFGPLPGSKRIAPGIKTTYAALIVPRTAESITLEALGCVLERRDAAPTNFEQATGTEGCTSAERRRLSIPGDTDGFWFQEARYLSVPSGEHATLLLRGNFSPQLSLLVNGYPLRRQTEIGTTPVIADALKGEAADGDFEFVNRGTVIARIRTSADFGGIPRISVITPQKARDINHFKVIVNGKCSSLAAVAASAPMFVAKPRGELRIVAFEPKSRLGRVQLVGAALQGTREIAINGTTSKIISTSPNVVIAEFALLPLQEDWNVLVAAGPDSAPLVLQMKHPYAVKEGAAKVLHHGKEDGGEIMTVSVALAVGQFDAGLDTFQFRSAEKDGDVRLAGSVATIDLKNVTGDLVVTLTRAGTPFGASWPLKKPAPPKTD